MQMVEWDMLLFFTAMFIMVEGAVELGLIDRIAQLLQLIINTSPPSARLVSEAMIYPHSGPHSGSIIIIQSHPLDASYRSVIPSHHASLCCIRLRPSKSSYGSRPSSRLCSIIFRQYDYNYDCFK